MTTGQQLQLFENLSFYEGADIEYKSAKGGLPGDLWPTYSAFANTAGGTIILGVSQRTDGLDVHGVPDPQRLLTEFWNLVNNRQKVSKNLLSERDVALFPAEQGERKCIRIRVPRAGRRERPVHVGPNPMTGTYRRNHEGDYLCGEDEVRRMFADQSEEPWDSTILENFDWSDLDAESVRQFRNRFRSHEPDHPWLAEDDKGLLTRLGGWRRDRRTGLDGLTMAGLLMFGKERAIRDPIAVPAYHLDYRERFSDDPGVRWTDRLTLDGQWEGNLFQFYHRVIQRLSGGPGIAVPFQVDREGFRQATTPVHEALQEALVNAIIHADYSGVGGVVIDRYLEWFEFSNPGTLLVSREQLLSGGISECRNPSLQLMFQKLRVGDRAGSGIDRIRRNWASQHWQSPALRETQRPDRVQLMLPMISLLPEGVVEALRARFGSDFDHLESDEVQALVKASSGQVSNQQLQEILTLHRVDITRMLQGLVRGGFLVPTGLGRGTRYQLAGVDPTTASGQVQATIAISPSELDMEDSAEEPGDSAVRPPGNRPGSTGIEGFSTGSCGSSTGSDDSSTGSGGSSAGTEGRDSTGNGGSSTGRPAGVSIHPEETPQIEAWPSIVEKVRGSRRADPAEVRRAISALCQDRFLTIKELAEVLNRNEGHLRDSYVRDMLKTGQLVLRYPGLPHHPHQAYRADGHELDSGAED